MSTDDGDFPEAPEWLNESIPSTETYIRNTQDYYYHHHFWKRDSCWKCPAWDGVMCYVKDEKNRTGASVPKKTCTEYDWTKFIIEYV